MQLAVSLVQYYPLLVPLTTSKFGNPKCRGGFSISFILIRTTITVLLQFWESEASLTGVALVLSVFVWIGGSLAVGYKHFP
jgi:type III secretory pathway component EscR